MAVYADTVTGTITLTSGSNAFTTSGVNMLTRGHLPGDSIYHNGFVLIIETITAENVGTLRDPCPAGASGSGVPVRIRYQPDGSRVQAQARNLIEKLGNGNIDAFSGLTGPGVVVFNTPSTLVVKPEADFINGIDFDVQVDTIADRAAYDGQAARYRVLVNDTGDGRSALYSKLTNANADWSDPAYITGPTGATPIVTASATTLAPGAAATVTTTPITGGVNLALGIPPGRSSGFSYTWSTTVTDANPGNGIMRANNANLSLATLLFISKTSVTGAAMATYLLNLASSTSPNKGELTIQRVDTGATASFVVTGVTDATNYVKVAVTTHSGVTAINNLTSVDFFFSRTGNSGAGDGDVKGPATSVNNRLAAFSGTTGKLIADSGIAPTTFWIDRLNADATALDARAGLELVKQINNLDTNASALMTVGAFGLGDLASSVTAANALDDITETGWRRVAAGASLTVNGPVSNVAGQVFTAYYGANNRYQTYNSVTGPVRSWHRNRIGSAGYSPWVEINGPETYARSNIIGTVSQTSGVPTGAIIEKGSNSNGSYTKFADGTQICWSIETSSAALNVARGSLFSTASNGWTYPASFIATPSISGIQEGSPGYAWVGEGGSVPNSSSCSWAAFAGTTTTAIPTVGLIAIGRWY